MRFDIKQPGGREGLSVSLHLEDGCNPRLLTYMSQGMLYEPDVAYAMMKIVRPGGMVIDVGANVGFFTVLAGLLVGPTGRVLAIEPDEANVERLEHHLRINELSNVEIVQQPASDRIGNVTFWTNSDGADGHALWDPAQYPGNRKSTADPRPMTRIATTLDHEWTQRILPTPRLVKIDTEGAERLVLGGATGLMAAGLPFIIAELHPFGLQLLGSSEGDLRRFMRDHGYETFLLFEDGTEPHHMAPDMPILADHIVNLLFSTPERVAEVWGEAT